MNCIHFCRLDSVMANGGAELFLNIFTYREPTIIASIATLLCVYFLCCLDTYYCVSRYASK